MVRCEGGIAGALPKGKLEEPKDEKRYLSPFIWWYLASHCGSVPETKGQASSNYGLVSVETSVPKKTE
jgi:hypothetical protein